MAGLPPILDTDLISRYKHLSSGTYIPYWHTFPSGERLLQHALLEVENTELPLPAAWSLYPNTERKFFELTQLIFAIKEKINRPLHLFVPFLPFGRVEDDIPFCQHLPQHLRMLGVERLFTLDPHGIDPRGVVEKISLKPFWQAFFAPDMQVILPDTGARARLDFPTIEPIVLEKTRCGPQVRVQGPKITASQVLIVDDMVDSGETLYQTACFIKNQGIKDIHAVVTHGIFSPGSLERIERAPLRTLYCGDSVFPPPHHPKIQSVPLLNFALKAFFG